MTTDPKALADELKKHLDWQLANEMAAGFSMHLSRETWATILAALRAPSSAEAMRLRKAIQDYLDGSYDSPRAHRPEPCRHGIEYYQPCEQCIDEHFQAALSPDPGPAPVEGWREAALSMRRARPSKRAMARAKEFRDAQDGGRS